MSVVCKLLQHYRRWNDGTHHIIACASVTLGVPVDFVHDVAFSCAMVHVAAGIYGAAGGSVADPRSRWGVGVRAFYVSGCRLGVCSRFSRGYSGGRVVEMRTQPRQCFPVNRFMAAKYLERKV